MRSRTAVFWFDCCNACDATAPALLACCIAWPALIALLGALGLFAALLGAVLGLILAWAGSRQARG